MSPAEIARITSNEVQDYIVRHGDDDVQRLLLQSPEKFGLRFGLIADQIIARKKIEDKAPLFFETKNLVYPPAVHLAQSSSQATAQLKLQLLQEALGKTSFARMADLTGGFGIDSYFLSRAVAQLHIVEPNESLLQMVQHNFHQLGVSSATFHAMTAEGFLAANADRFDFIFVDPSRKDARHNKLVRFADCAPNLLSLLPVLFSHTDAVLVKASPLLDLTQGTTELKSVHKIFVVAVNNECREVLFLLRSGQAKPSIETFDLDKFGKMRHRFSFFPNDEADAQSEFGEPQTYLYEPNAALLKAGAFKLVGQKFDLKKMHVNTHLYSSDVLHRDFPGRIFRIDHLVAEAKNIPGRKANVVTRNYPVKAEELRKKMKLEDGGESYVIAFTGARKKYVLQASRLE